MSFINIKFLLRNTFFIAIRRLLIIHILLSHGCIYCVTSSSANVTSLNNSTKPPISRNIQQDPLYGALLFDMMPPSSSECQIQYQNTSNTNNNFFHYDYDFISTENTSSWDPMAVPYEEQVFLAHCISLFVSISLESQQTKHNTHLWSYGML